MDQEAPLNWNFASGVRKQTPEAGDRYGPFTILEELGQGGMGAVYRAQDPAGRVVALKLLGKSSTAKDRARFEREGQLTASLRHPGIIRVFAAGEEGDSRYLAYELVEGRDLEASFEDMSREELLRVLLEVARAVGYAHSRSVIHRDLKPANVFLDEAGRPRVADFGVARAEHLDRLTATGALVGTPRIMAPEQFAGDPKRLGPPLDVWALGVILYRVLTRQDPFAECRSLGELAVAIAEREIPAPRRVAKGVSPELNDVCLRALDRDELLRYPDANAFADALAEALDAKANSRLLPAASLAGLALLLLVTAPFLRSREVPSPVPTQVVPAQAAGANPSPTPSAPGPAVLLAEAEALLLAGDLAGGRDRLREAVEAGSSEARTALARLLVAAGATAEGVRLLEEGHRAGDLRATADLGLLHYEGRHLPQNHAAARELWEQAAEGGDPVGMRCLGEALLEGEPAPEEFTRAMGLLRRAGEAGDGRAWAILGVYYARGGAVAQDLTEALACYEAGHAAGDPLATFNLGNLYLTGKAVAPDRARGVELIRSAAEKGLVEALNLMGCLSAEGIGVERDEVEARRWLREAAQRGHPKSMYDLAAMLSTGRGGPPDERSSVTWILRAAREGYPPAELQASLVYAQGLGGVAPDLQAAARWTRLAAGHGVPAAIFNLAGLTERGEGGVERDLDEARRLYERAAASDDVRVSRPAKAALERLDAAAR